MTLEIPQTTFEDIRLITSVCNTLISIVCNKIGKTKPPGSDGVPNVALKAVITCRPELFLYVYNSYLHEKVYPTPWK